MTEIGRERRCGGGGRLLRREKEGILPVRKRQEGSRGVHSGVGVPPGGESTEELATTDNPRAARGRAVKSWCWRGLI